MGVFTNIRSEWLSSKTSMKARIHISNDYRSLEYWNQSDTDDWFVISEICNIGCSVLAILEIQVLISHCLSH